MSMKASSGATMGMSGSYNTNSKPQLAAVEVSTLYIREAIDVLDIAWSPSSLLMIADFGSAHGANSIYAMKKIISYLRETKKNFGELLVIHNDLPSNDWTSVFELLADENSYVGVASGRSFYERCLPNNSIAVGYSSTSIHWLSKKPCNVGNHCSHLFGTNDELVAFKDQARADYVAFLEHRSCELLPGGVLVLVIPSANEQGKTGLEDIHELLYKCSQSLPLSPKEILDYTIPSYPRSYQECVDKELFAQCSFQLVKGELAGVTASTYEQWQKGEITLDQFAQTRTQFVRAWAEPILRQVLESSEQRSKAEINELLIQFWTMFEHQVQERPEKHQSPLFFTYLVLKKIPVA